MALIDNLIRFYWLSIKIILFISCYFCDISSFVTHMTACDLISPSFALRYILL